MLIAPIKKIPAEFPEDKKEESTEPTGGLSRLRKRLEADEEINPQNAREITIRNLNSTKNILQNPAPLRDNLGSLKAENKIMPNKKIDNNFFLKQRGFSSSNIQHGGGRL